jgi:hypothetical protein
MKAIHILTLILFPSDFLSETLFAHVISSMIWYNYIEQCCFCNCDSCWADKQMLSPVMNAEDLLLCLQCVHYPVAKKSILPLYLL